MPTFSTQASVEARISEDRLRTYTDFDGDLVADTATINAGIAFAGAYISGRLKVIYGQTEIDTWVLPSDVPPLIGWLSDTLCIYNYAVAKPNLFADVNIDLMFDRVEGILQQLIDGQMELDGVSPPVSDEFVTERIKSDFDPKRDLDNQSVRTTWILPDARSLPGYPE